MTNTLSGHVMIQKLVNDQMVELDDQLAVEEPLEIRLSYVGDNKRITKSISVTMRTPGNDKELAAGFLFTEGIIHHHQQVDAITLPAFEENIVLVSLQENVVPLLQKTDRNFYTTSSCGVCGKSSIDAIRTVSSYIQQPDDMTVKATVLYKLQDELREHQLIFQSTGGLHAAALFDLSGKMEGLCEDVGRHNAVDKLIGTRFINNELPLTGQVLLLSGRASFELVQKAAMAGIKIVAAVGAPSTLAVQLAKECGITLLGFLRNERFNIYSGPQRIQL